MSIEVDIHTHTIASGHAYSTLAENAAAAAKQDIKLLAVTDHGPAMPGSPHIWFFKNMRVIPRLINGVGILRGAETNIINSEGEIDIHEPLLAQMDIILASLHEPVLTPSTRTINTDTVIKAMASGKIDVLAHGGNPSFPIDVEAIAKTAAFYNVLIEINNSSFTTSRPGSENNCLLLARAVAKHDGKLIFGSDAHIADKVGKFSECLALTEKINFPRERILSFNAYATLEFLKEKNKQNLEELFLLLS
jgi:putative hydrolase